MEKVQELEGALAAEKAKNTALEAALEAASQEIAALNVQIESLSKRTGSAVSSKKVDLFPADWSEKTFKIGKDTFGFIVPQFAYKGEVVTYAQILADTTLQKELVDAENGCIIKK